MIHQISYRTNAYDDFFLINERYSSQINHRIWYDDEIEYFLKHFGYYDLFHSKVIQDQVKFAETAIRCDFLRIMILKEFGGLYIDADVIFKDNIVKIEEDLYETFGGRTLVTDNKSLFFLRSDPDSELINYFFETYKNARVLRLDVKMFEIFSYRKFLRNMMIISYKYLYEYFKHTRETTGLMKKGRK